MGNENLLVGVIRFLVVSLRFRYLTPGFLLCLHFIRWLLSLKAAKEGDTFLNFNFIFEFNNHSVGVRILPETSRNGHVS